MERRRHQPAGKLKGDEMMNKASSVNTLCVILFVILIIGTTTYFSSDCYNGIPHAENGSIKATRARMSEDLSDRPLIVSAHWNEDLEWLASTGFRFAVCDKIPNPSYVGDGTCDVELNIGRECSSYLRYILNAYDDLPPRICFVHGHKDAPHQLCPMDVAIRAANESTLPYVTLNGHLDYERHGEWKNAIDIFKNRFPRFWREGASYLALDGSSGTQADSSAQFCVSRDRILRIPRSIWKILYDELLEIDDYASCQALELMWHVIMGENQMMLSPCGNYADQSLLSACEATLAR